MSTRVTLDEFDFGKLVRGKEVSFMNGEVLITLADIGFQRMRDVIWNAQYCPTPIVLRPERLNDDARKVLEIQEDDIRYRFFEPVPRVIDQMRLYEGSLFGGSHGDGSLRMSEKDSPKRKGIIAGRKSYNKLREHVGLPRVTDWTTRPAVTSDNMSGEHEQRR